MAYSKWKYEKLAVVVHVHDTELGHFSLFFLQRTAKKCTMISNARAQLLFCSLNQLSGDVRVVVVVVVVVC